MLNSIQDILPNRTNMLTCIHHYGSGTRSAGCLVVYEHVDTCIHHYGSGTRSAGCLVVYEHVDVYPSLRVWHQECWLFGRVRTCWRVSIITGLATGVLVVWSCTNMLTCIHHYGSGTRSAGCLVVYEHVDVYPSLRVWHQECWLFGRVRTCWRVSIITGLATGVLVVWSCLMMRLCSVRTYGVNITPR